MRLVHNGEISLHRLLGAMTFAPADLMRIDAGRLAVGQPADLVVIDPARSWIVDEQKLRSSSKNTPFEHARFEGYATRTIVAGETVFERN